MYHIILQYVSTICLNDCPEPKVIPFTVIVDEACPIIELVANKLLHGVKKRVLDFPGFAFVKLVRLLDALSVAISDIVVMDPIGTTVSTSC